MHYMVHKVEKELDTRDKRWMFLKLLFPHSLPMIDIEGTPRKTASEIIGYFIKNDQICEFEDMFFKHFGE